jgi:hypothetical protein
VRISSTGAIEGGRVLYTIGRIEAASAGHPENGAPLQDNWEELVLRELIRKAEDIDADAIIRVDYQSWPPHSYRRDRRETQTRRRHRHCGQAFLRGLEYLPIMRFVGLKSEERLSCWRSAHWRAHRALISQLRAIEFGNAAIAVPQPSMVCACRGAWASPRIERT